MASSVSEAVGWAKALHWRRDGALTVHAVPTIHRGKQGGGHGAARLCPPYGVTQVHHHQLPSGFVSSSGKYFSTHRSGFGAAWPRPQIEASRMAAESSSSSFSFHGPRAISLAAFSVPTRHGVHWPQLSSSKNFIRLSA